MLAALIQVAGLALVALGVAILSIPAGLVVAGLGLFAIGLVLDIGPARRRRQ